MAEESWKPGCLSPGKQRGKILGKLSVKSGAVDECPHVGMDHTKDTQVTEIIKRCTQNKSSQT